MVAELGARDRPIMVGLVVLGVLTVIAGVLSGRTTIQYVLAKDASDAATHWAKEADALLHEGGDASVEILGKAVDRLEPEQLTALLSGRETAAAQIGRARLSSSSVAGLERFIFDLVFAGSDQAAGEHVSKLEGFAVLDANGTPVATAGLPAARVNALLGESAVASDLENALAEAKVAVAHADAAGRERPLVIVPVGDGSAPAYAYAFFLD